MLIQSNIYDAYEIYPCDSMDVKLPIKTMSGPISYDGVKANTMKWNDYRNLWKYLDGKSVLKLATECIKLWQRVS